jgi:hypothetical protein
MDLVNVKFGKQCSYISMKLEKYEICCLTPAVLHFWYSMIYMFKYYEIFMVTY